MPASAGFNTRRKEISAAEQISWDQLSFASLNQTPYSGQHSILARKKSHTHPLLELNVLQPHSKYIWKELGDPEKNQGFCCWKKEE